MCHGYQSSRKLIMLTHFNDKKPENHNILLTNLRSKTFNVFDGKKWAGADTMDTIENLYLKNRVKIIDMYDTYKDELDPMHLRWITNFIDKDDADDNAHYNNIKLDMYNGRDQVMKTRKLHEQCAIAS